MVLSPIDCRSGASSWTGQRSSVWILMSTGALLWLLLVSLPTATDAFLIGLSATNQNCTNEGQEVVVTIVANNPCFECMCKDGHVQCRKETCPDTQGCYVVLQQSNKSPKCCQSCKGCHYRGVHYPSGSEWSDPEDPCQVMACQGGVMTLSRQTCRYTEDAQQTELQCDQILPARPGECCPRCRGCWLNGTALAEGQSVVPDPIAEPCTTCRCVSGSTQCTKRTCPVLACPPNKALLKPGTCCPVCQGVRNEVVHQPGHPEAGRCHVGRKMYPSGATFRPDGCTNCTCQPDSTTLCYRSSGNCSSNSGGKMLALLPGKIPKGNRFGRIQDKQQQEAAAASTPEQQQMFLPQMSQEIPPAQPLASGPGQQLLAPTALPASRPLTCAYRGVTYQDGASWSLDPCTQCSCSQSEVHCSVQQCPVYRPKEHHRHSSSKSQAKLAVSGSKSSSGAALFGKLGGGGSSTVQPGGSQPCPPGRHPVKEPGQCCPKCIEDDAVCTVFGDPHYRTFDGRVFNFQGTCKYLLTADCKNDSFSVRVTNDARSSRSFSWTKTVTLTIEDLKVTLGQNMKVKINHKRVSLPFVSLGVLSVVQEGYSVVVRTNLGVKLLWDGESFLEVTAPPSFKRRLCGLCGNFNGRRRDDLRMRNGHTAKSVEEFGQSWKVGGPKSCSLRSLHGDHPNQLAVLKKTASKGGGGITTGVDGEPALCQRQWHVRIRAIRECSVLKSATFAQCHSQVSPVRFFKSCLLDMCECPPGKQCYCEALTAYAHECARHGVTQIDPKWREVTSCNGHHLS